MQNEIKSMPCNAVCLIFLETLGALISMTCAEEIVGVLTASQLPTSEVYAKERQESSALKVCISP